MMGVLGLLWVEWITKCRGIRLIIIKIGIKIGIKCLNQQL